MPARHAPFLTRKKKKRGTGAALDFFPPPTDVGPSPRTRTAGLRRGARPFACIKPPLSVAAAVAGSRGSISLAQAPSGRGEKGFPGPYRKDFSGRLARAESFTQTKKERKCVACLAYPSSIGSFIPSFQEGV